MKIKFKILPLVFFLVLLIEINIAFSSAKFSSSMFGGSAAKVAKFDAEVKEISTKTKFQITYQNKIAEYQFSIKNKSEVSVKYNVVVIMPNQAPDNVTLTLKDNSGTIHTATKSGTNYTFEGIYIAGANEASEQVFTLQFKFSNLESVSEDINLTDIQIKAYVIQED